MVHTSLRSLLTIFLTFSKRNGRLIVLNVKMFEPLVKFLDKCSSAHVEIIFREVTEIVDHLLSLVFRQAYVSVHESAIDKTESSVNDFVLDHDHFELTFETWFVNADFVCPLCLYVLQGNSL